MKKVGKWMYNNLLLEKWYPMGVGCALTIVCGLNDLYVATVIGLLFVILPTGLQAFGYTPMD